MHVPQMIRFHEIFQQHLFQIQRMHYIAYLRYDSINNAFVWVKIRNKSTKTNFEPAKYIVERVVYYTKCYFNDMEDLV